VKQIMTANQWMPFPTERIASGVHTRDGAAVYYLAEQAIAEHGLDNEIAGLLQAALLPQVTTALASQPALATTPGEEDAYLLFVANAMANALTKDLASALGAG
jgi:hypothetical protein